MADSLRLLWTASRDWTEPLRMWDVLGECRAWAREQGKTLIIVQGDAGGGDQIAKLYGLITEGCEQESYPADWEGPCRDTCKPGHRRNGKNGRPYCPAAGNYRNEGMVALGADRCAAWIKAGSAGASNCARLAERAGIPTRRFTECTLGEPCHRPECPYCYPVLLEPRDVAATTGSENVP
jgi:YspA, cpYpsA-related SLOG family